MTRYDDETLIRRIDGEMPVAERDRIDAAAESDADLAARLAALRTTDAAACAAFPIQSDARDVDLARLIMASSATPMRSAGWKLWLGQAFAPRSAVIWGGLATAAFVAGLLIAPSLQGSAGFALANNGVVLDTGLVRVLDTRLAGDGADAQGRAVGLTFRDGEGRWCRTFTTAREGVAGLVCRDGGAWRLQALAPAAASTGELRTASSDTPALVLQAVDAAIAGDAADAAAEHRARDGGWR
ncbi:hypothetical protein RM53_07465 [Brevundimonas nasdae]|uniref:Anti-sigma factor n=1 Tax=Brevundimonas nasdae TaxID=172043 RepID=A0A0B4DXM6_9CAUL|nr:hypothetical protein [Brevundimonas nasdae]KIC59013.1 hypothetical protein RM53_07465 [Brevundimonas nasdae]